MNVRDLLDVRVICETGSLRKAAALLGITQPTLSSRIALLEDRLGATLFDRSRGRSEPTDLTRFIAHRAETMAGEAEKLTREVKRLSSGKAGVVRVGLAATPARVLFPEIAVEISERFSALSLEMLCAPTAQLAAMLIDRDLDLLVAPELEVLHPSVTKELMLETDIIVLARPDHPLCAAPPATIAGLFEYPIALPIAERHYLDKLREDFGIDIDSLPGHMLCSDPGMLARIVQCSERLFTAAPRFYFAPEIEAGTLRVVDTPVPYRHALYLHWNRDAFPLPAVDTVLRLTREYFARRQSRDAASLETRGGT